MLLIEKPFPAGAPRFRPGHRRENFKDDYRFTVEKRREERVSAAAAAVAVEVVVVEVVEVGAERADGHNRAEGELIDGSSCPRGEQRRQTAGHL